ncbi:MAG: hypothetical protein K0Q79_461 [Flavipsychrobacter sp.]|jgi:hypothetical protein|nr:hypothetical protein [Flavipsychrobacter sp.]
MRVPCILLLSTAIFSACQKRNVTVYECKCSWVRASTNKDTSKTLSFADMIKGTAQSSCNDQKAIIPKDTDVKDSVACNLL